jgi:hypothetical protein
MSKLSRKFPGLILLLCICQHAISSPDPARTIDSHNNLVSGSIIRPLKSPAYCLPVIYNENYNKLWTRDSPDSIIYYIYFSDIDSIPQMKNAYGYDEQDYRILWIRSFWDEINSCWEYDLKVDYSNDEEGRDTIDFIYLWEDDNWIPYGREDNMYSPDGEIVEHVQLSWDPDSNTYVNLTRWTADILDEGLHFYLRNYFWDTIEYEWVEEMRTHFYLTENGFVYYQEEKIWDEVQEEWVFFYTMEAEFNENGLPETEISYFYDDGTDVPTGGYKDTYTYNKDDLKILDIFWNWEGDDTWTPFKKDSMTYYPDAKPFEIYTSYMPSDELWHMHDKTEYIYTSCTEIIITSYYSGVGDWTIMEGYYAFYPCVIEALTTPAKHEIIVYPNPFSDYISFESYDEIDRIELYDLQGKLLFSTIVHEAVQMPESIPEGSYYLVIYKKGTEIPECRLLIKD